MVVVVAMQKERQIDTPSPPRLPLLGLIPPRAGGRTVNDKVDAINGIERDTTNAAGAGNDGTTTGEAIAAALAPVADPAAASHAMDIVYNIGDAINKIGFGLVIYALSRKEA